MKLASLFAFTLAAGMAYGTVYSNGPVSDGVNASNQPISQLFAPASIFGAGHQITANNALAENFTVTGAGWTVSRFSFFAYQTGAVGFTFTGANVEIVTGSDPNAGSSVYSVANAAVANGGFVAYRVTSTVPDVTNRPIYRIDVFVNNLSLAPGNYMVKWSIGGSLTSGPWAPPVAPFVAGNAYQSISGGVYNPLIDTGNNLNLEMPFEVEYLPVASNGHLYAVDSSRALYELDMNTGARTSIGTVSANAGTTGGLAFANSTRTIYLTSTGNDSLYTLDLSTGTATLVGAYGDASVVMHGIEWDDRSGILYGESQHNTGLYTLNTSTGLATLIGSSGLSSFQNLGYDLRSNTMYCTSSGNDSLYIMDRTTGLATLVGPLNGPTNPNGLAYNWITDTLYLVDNTTDNLYTINRTTGQATVVGSMGASNILGLVFIAPARLAGRIGLEDWTGPLAGREVEFSIYPAGGGSLVDYYVGTLDSLGRFWIPTNVGPGAYDIYAKASHWLQKRRANVNITAAGASGVNFSLVNGDIDDDNEVGIGDYSRLSTSYNLAVGDPGYDVEADLNGDDAVDIADYSILSSNYGLAGD
ncbi:MAG: hypothetical protein K1X67_19940 [Fimbriimonadaceae bacterium]|nr:hypothetical protein [Fimbriimonadaceae bacterium]